MNVNLITNELQKLIDYICASASHYRSHFQAICRSGNESSIFIHAQEKKYIWLMRLVDEVVSVYTCPFLVHNIDTCSV